METVKISAWSDALENESGDLFCPEATEEFLPTCQQAGRIMAQRCEDAGLDEKTCNDLSEKTKSYAANMGSAAFGAVNETRGDDLLMQDNAWIVSCLHLIIVLSDLLNIFWL